MIRNHICVISERSCDTEDCSNDIMAAENPALTPQELHYKTLK